MLHLFMQRFSHVSHNIPEAPDAAIVTAFSANVRDIRMREKLSVRKVHTVNKLYALADRCARAEEGCLAPERAKKAEAGPASSGGKKRLRKRSSHQALAVEPSTSMGADKKAKTEVAAAKPAGGVPWCPIHESDAHDA